MAFGARHLRLVLGFFDPIRFRKTTHDDYLLFGIDFNDAFVSIQTINDGIYNYVQNNKVNFMLL